MKHKIAAVVVTFNRKELLRESIGHLLRQTIDSFDVYVIDNASTDGTCDHIADLLKNERIHYFNTGKNLGGAGGFHFGIKEAVKAGYEYLWIMDDDTMPAPEALYELLDAKEVLKDNFGFLCSDVKWTDGKPCVMNVPNIAKDWSQSSEYLKNGLLKVKQCSFVSCFFSAETVRRIGLPFKEFFIWGDDAEYTKRISDAAPSYLVSRSVVVHKMHSNIPTDISKDAPDRLFRYQFSYRNLYYVNKQEGSKLDMILYYYTILLDIKKVIRSKQKGKWKKIRIILKSVRAGRKFRPKVEYVEEESGR